MLAEMQMYQFLDFDDYGPVDASPDLPEIQFLDRIIQMDAAQWILWWTASIYAILKLPEVQDIANDFTV